MGPSIRLLLFLSMKLLAAVVALTEVGVTVPVGGSEMLPDRNRGDRCILQIKMVVSREPLTRYLLSGDRDKQVTGAQWPFAISRVFAPSGEIKRILLSTCPPGMKNNI